MPISIMLAVSLKLKKKTKKIGIHSFPVDDNSQIMDKPITGSYQQVMFSLLWCLAIIITALADSQVSCWENWDLRDVGEGTVWISCYSASPQTIHLTAQAKIEWKSKIPFFSPISCVMSHYHYCRGREKVKYAT